MGRPVRPARGVLGRTGYAADPDAQLVAELQAGVREAFDELYSKYRGRVMAYFWNRVGADFAEDLMQETFLRCYESIGQFAYRGAFYAWLWAIARTVLRKHLAEKSGGAAVSATELPIDERGTVASEGSSWKSVGAAERQAILRQDQESLTRALEGLEPDDREVLRMFYWEAHPIAEIARKIGKTPGATKMMLARARAELKRVIGLQEGIQ